MKLNPFYLVRALKNMSIVDLRLASGVTAPTIYSIERGQRKASIGALHKLAGALFPGQTKDQEKLIVEYLEWEVENENNNRDVKGCPGDVPSPSSSVG
jgi:transcriptional regulator with XRE-family HTH domain